jgi:hypothetical protein
MQLLAARSATVVATGTAADTDRLCRLYPTTPQAPSPTPSGPC